MKKSLVKPLYLLRIKDYNLFEQSGNTRYLMRAWLPIGFLYRKQIEAFLTDFAQKLGSDNDTDANLQKETYRIRTMYRIQLLIALYQALYNLMVNKNQVDVWLTSMNKSKPSNYSNLIEYVDKIKKLANIEITADNWQDEMIQLKDYITRIVDKYEESFAPEKKSEGITFQQLVLGVFSALEQPINENIRISVFLEMKRQAEEIAQTLKLKQNG